MFIFFLLSVCFAAQTTYTIGGQGQIVIQFDKEKFEASIKDKCLNAEIFSFKITNEKKFAVYATKDCSSNAIATIDMKEIAKELPPVQQQITIEGDIKVTLGFPYGCLLKYLPEITGEVKGAMNFEFVHTQFGADIHMYTTEKTKQVEECKGIDTIVQMFSKENAAALSEKVKFILNDVNVTVDNALTFGEGAVNMFKEIAKDLYNKAVKMMKDLQLNEEIYEFNGEVMKVYKYVEETFNGIKQKVLKLDREVIKAKASEIIGKLKEGTEEFSITASCDPRTGSSFGYYDGKLQMTTAEKCQFSVNGFNLNMKLNISAVLGKENKIEINGKQYSFTEMNNYSKDLLTQSVAVIQSYGSHMEFQLNQCKPISILDVVDTFHNLAYQFFGNGLPKVNEMMKPIIDNAIQQGQSVKKAIEAQLEAIRKIFPNFNLPTYYYKVGLLKTGVEGKSFATYGIYEPSDTTCKNPNFEFVIGVVSDLKVQQIETGYELIRYLDKSTCDSKKGSEGYYSEHIETGKCINGYKFKFANNELKMISCDNIKKVANNDDTTYKCNTCVECQKKAAMTGDYAYVTCGTSSIFILLVALIFFILF